MEMEEGRYGANLGGTFLPQKPKPKPHAAGVEVSRG